jgi:GAF domain-containing protein
VAAFADPASAAWPAHTVDETPTPETCDTIRRGSALTVPLLVHGRPIGSLTLRRSGHRPWEPGDQPLVEQLASHAAHAIHQACQWSGARQELALRGSMVRLLSAIDTTATPRQVFELLLEEAQTVVQADDGGGARWDHERDVLLPAMPKTNTEAVCAVQRPLMVALAAGERCTLIENEYQRTIGRATPAGRAGAQAVLAVPLVHRDRVMGSISISHIATGPRFRPSDARRVEQLASTAALVLAGIERQRKAGAQLAARKAAHLVNNDLTLTMGSLDLMRQSDDLPEGVDSLVDSALAGVSQAAKHLAQLQRLTRAETVSGPLGPHLDVSGSTAQDAAL